MTRESLTPPTYAEVCRGIEMYHEKRMWRELVATCNLGLTMDLGPLKRKFLEDTKRVGNGHSNADSTPESWASL